jgi:hypothetical protein
MTTTDHDTPAERVSDAAIAAYIELGNRVIPGPWEWDRANDDRDLISLGVMETEYGEFGSILARYPKPVIVDAYAPDKDSAAFIAQSRTIGPALAEEVLEWRKLEAEMRENDYTEVDGGWDEAMGAFVEYSREPAPETPKRTEPCTLTYRGETLELPIGHTPVTGMIIRWMREVDSRQEAHADDES